MFHCALPYPILRAFPCPLLRDYPYSILHAFSHLQRSLVVVAFMNAMHLQTLPQLSLLQSKLNLGLTVGDLRAVAKQVCRHAHLQIPLAILGVTMLAEQWPVAQHEASRSLCLVVWRSMVLAIIANVLGRSRRLCEVGVYWHQTRKYHTQMQIQHAPAVGGGNRSDQSCFC